jgi:hypothetical protein
MVYGQNDYWFKVMEKDTPYYFQIEAINASGVSERSSVTKSE